MMDLTRILIAPLVWLAVFSGVYGLHGVICGFEIYGNILGVSLARVLMVTAYLGAVLIQLGLLWVMYQDRFAAHSAFVQFVSKATAWVGVVAAVWTLLPTAVTTYCL